MWSMHQQETSSLGHAILEAGMPPFFLDWGKNLKYRKIPQLGSHRKQASWGKNLKYREIPQLGSHRKQVDWSKTAENQAKSPNDYFNNESHP